MDITERQIKILETNEGEYPFIDWFSRFKDIKTSAAIRSRLARVRSGNFGDWKIVGDVIELRIDFGSGYRIYLGEREKTLIVLLVGGDKKTQSKDIKTANDLWRKYKNETDRFQRDF